MIFKISKEKFWDNTSGIERWPEMLKKLPRYIKYTDKNKIAEEYFGMKKDEKGRLTGSYEVYGLFGGEVKGDSVILTGSNFIKKNENGFELANEAVDLVNAYDNDAKWELLLVGQLLKYSLRMRAIMTALFNGGRFYFKDGYLKGRSKSYLEYRNKKYYVFYDKSDKENLNSLMRLYPEKTVGEFWLNEFNISNEQREDIEIKGVSNPDPSINCISTQIKIPMVLLKYLGYIKEVEVGYYGLNKDKLKSEMSEELFDSFILEEQLEELSILKNIINKHKDYRGYFPVSVVGEDLKKIIDLNSSVSIDNWIDRYFISRFNSNKFKLVTYQQGQPRHGRGLLGKKEQQLIKIEFNE